MENPMAAGVRDAATPRIKILDVRTSHGNGRDVLGLGFEQPGRNSAADGYSFEVQGWVLGTRSPVTHLVLSGLGIPAKKLPVNLARPDIADAFPDVPWAAASGVQGAISSLALGPSFAIQLRTVHADGTVCDVGAITGRREISRPVEGASAIQPLILTTLGRTGSTWLTKMLGQHPQIIALDPHIFEPRAAPYWMSVLTTLAEPQSYHQILAPDVYGPEWWLGGQRQLRQLSLTKHATMRDWLEGEYIEGLMRFSIHQIGDFYRHAVDAERYELASHFVEKVWPGSPTQEMLAELYPGTREVFLVRDFRDMACSVSAFNRRLGYESFGRENVETDEDYVSGPLRDNAELMLRMWERCKHRAHLLRYEDLVADTSGALTALLEYLGVDSSADTVERMGSRTGVKVDLDRHMTASSVAASVGRWRTDLSDSVRKRFEEHYGDVLSAFGYDAQ